MTKQKKRQACAPKANSETGRLEPTKKSIKLASKVLRARSESFTDSSDNSYASEINNNDSSEASATSGSTADSSSASKGKQITSNHVKKESTTSGGSTGASDPDQDSDFSDGELEDEEEAVEDEEENESSSSEEEAVEEDESESEEEEQESESEESEEEVEAETPVICKQVNGDTKKKQGYDLDDFQLLKTIGEYPRFIIKLSEFVPRDVGVSGGSIVFSIDMWSALYASALIAYLFLWDAHLPSIGRCVYTIQQQQHRPIQFYLQTLSPPITCDITCSLCFPFLFFQFPIVACVAFVFNK